eukprot:203101_1
MARKLRLLCLHGYLQNDRNFRGRCGSLKRGLRDIADLYFLCAPHEVPVSTMSSNEYKAPETVINNVNPKKNPPSNTPKYTWWFASDDGSIYRDWKDSVDYVLKFMESEGPFDGILGFSQGATMAALVCAHLQHDDSGAVRVRCVFLAGGFVPRAEDVRKALGGNIDCPSLHVIGSSDQIVEQSRSKDLAKFFTNPTISVHSGGHFIPADKPMLEVYRQFLRSIEPIS